MGFEEIRFRHSTRARKIQRAPLFMHITSGCRLVCGSFGWFNATAPAPTK
jgi:hypothetical protein